ncbi:hypothetical protein K502DRAFT_282867, partial [Neoconidiobolus thromboides FSU 785]
LVEARELKNKDGFFGKNDAYCDIHVGGRKEKTSVIKNAGKKATWNQTFNYTIDDNVSEIKVECLDYDKISTNDLIGKVKIPLRAVRQFGRIEGWYPLTDKAKFSGEVHLIIQF